MVRSDGYSFGKIVYHAFNRGRTKPLSPESKWNNQTTVVLCLFIAPLILFYPRFFEWVGVDFFLSDLEIGLRWLALVIIQFTFIGITISLYDYEYVTLGTMIHRPVELVVILGIFLMGEIHWQAFVFMFAGVPVPAGVCFYLWKRDTQISNFTEYWQALAHPQKTRSVLGKWLEKIGWIILGVGALTLFQPGWLLGLLDISQEPLVMGYFRVVGWAYIILGWCYFMNARHEHEFFFDVVLLQNFVGLLCSVFLWTLGWFSKPLLLLLLLGHAVVLLSTIFFAWLETRQA